MRIIGNELRLAATDLSNHLACRHTTTLDRSLARGEVAKPDWTDPFTAVLSELGRSHEAAYLDHLKGSGLTVVEFGDDPDGSSAALERTAEAMREGVDAIYQPALRLGRWTGRADILRRAEKHSALGPWSYEAVDCKLARTPRAGAILQLAVYSACLEEIQDVLPERMYVLTPRTGFVPTPFRTADYFAYYRSVAERLLRALEEESSDTYPEPAEHCAVCRWWRNCDDRRRKDDHPGFVAGISRMQIEQLREWDVETLEALARLPVPLERTPRRGAADSYVRIREQARVQAEARQTAKPVYELLPFEPGQGLGRLPEPSPGDLFLDLEGDRFAGEGGMDYLFGFVFVEPDGTERYDCRWAFDAESEKKAFEWAVDRIAERRREHPGAHVYHFGHYEPSALKRLMGCYAARESEVDALLRGEALVDLHVVVRQALRAGIERYSLKDLEPLHGFERETPLEEANLARRSVERAIELAAANKIAPDARDRVQSYNRDDCRSTLRLRDWLERLRAERIEAGEEIARPVAEDEDPSEDLAERQAAVAQRVIQLTEGVPVAVEDRTPEQHGRWLLAHLLDYHRRESKAEHWEYFRRLDLDEDDYAEDKGALAGLSYQSSLGVEGRSSVDRYRFPPQEVDIRRGSRLKVPRIGDDGKRTGATIGTVVEIDATQGWIDVKKTGDAQDLHPTGVFEDRRFGTKGDPRPGSLLALADWAIEEGLARTERRGAAGSVLLRLPPRLKGGGTCEGVLADSASTVEAAKRLALDLEDSVLPIQGPPGAGKTYTGARIICELARVGRKIGVTALGHKAIENLLKEAVRAAAEEGVDLRCVRKISRDEADSPAGVEETTDNARPLQALESGEVQLAAGTSWLWARPEYEGSLDVMIVDEAGQLPLADVLAVSRAARSIILLGDPAQLEQPQQGSHPDGVGVSALEHLMGEERLTLPEDRGLFLPETRRLHPAICDFTSEVFYENRLRSHDGLERQALVDAGPFSGAGLRLVPVHHRGNQNSSLEEADAVRRIVEFLLAGRTHWDDAQAERRPLEPSDILVVAPYNAQVAEIARSLPNGARVGTVDKFQGQQAPVVVYSMTTSAAEDAPRGMDFLYALDRFNVATSRARCAVILVASPRLLEPECRTPKQMRLANALCRYAELARVVRLEEIGRRAAGATAGDLP